MKKVFLIGLLCISIYSSSQDNYFTYNGLADVNMRFKERGAGGRAIVHNNFNSLALNFEGDFTGGTFIGSNTYFSNTGNSFINTGNVGIGTATPTSKLVVREGAEASSLNCGSIGFNRSVSTGEIYNSSKNAWQFTARSERFTLEKYTGAGVQSNPFSVSENGNVGIGTISPQKVFQVDAPNTDAGVRLHAPTGDNNTNTPFLLLTGGYQPNNGVAMRGVSDGTYGKKALAFYSGWSANSDNPLITDIQERMRISATGNVGIGNNAPKNKLSVKGSANVEIGQYSITTPTAINYGAIGFNNTVALSTSNYALSGTTTVTNINAATTLNLNIANTPKVVIESGGTTVNGALTLGSTNVNSNNTKIFLRNPGAAWNGDPGGKTWAISSGANNVAESKFAIYNWTDHSADFQSYFAISHDGKVGIGNNNPISKLDVTGDLTLGNNLSYSLIKGRCAGAAIQLGTNSNTWDRNLHLGFVGNDVNNSVFTPALSIIHLNGKVGIGTTNPDTKLDVQVPHVAGQNDAIRIGSAFNNNFYGVGLNYKLSNPGGDPSSNLVVYAGGAPINAMSFNGYNGRVGIGVTPDKFEPNSILTVNGKITAEEVEIKDVAADFVFQKDYQLKPLHEVESYINENQHLPGVAPASETVKGVELSKFNTLLLQKVEELTLYVIAQQKEINALKQQASKK
jgi:hypothetical protein